MIAFRSDEWNERYSLNQVGSTFSLCFYGDKGEEFSEFQQAMVRKISLLQFHDKSQGVVCKLVVNGAACSGGWGGDIESMAMRASIVDIQGMRVGTLWRCGISVNGLSQVWPIVPSDRSSRISSKMKAW